MQAVTFDHSGQYLAVGGGDARVYGSKQDWAALATFPDLPKKVRFFDWTTLFSHASGCLVLLLNTRHMYACADTAPADDHKSGHRGSFDSVASVLPPSEENVRKY